MKSLYRLDTGELTGVRVHGSPEVLALNTEPGCAWVEGAHDPRTAQVQLVTDDYGELQPIVVARRPERPPDSEFRSWAWDAAGADWVPTYTLLWHQAQARPPLLALLEQLDARLARPLGEIAQAQALGDPLPSAAVHVLQAVNTDKQLVRARLAAVSAAADADALAELLADPLALSSFTTS